MLISCPNCRQLFHKPDSLGVLCPECQYAVDNQDEPYWDGEDDCPFCEGDGCHECDGTGEYT
jgi:hypothetical protein